MLERSAGLFQKIPFRFTLVPETLESDCLDRISTFSLSPVSNFSFNANSKVENKYAFKSRLPFPRYLTFGNTVPDAFGDSSQ